MSRLVRTTLKIAAALIALLVILALAGLVTLRTAWFHDLVRERMIAAIEKATGGASSMGGYSFDWKTLTARVDNFVLHGTEPAGSPPLFQAQSITATLRIISVFKKQIDLQSVDVRQPRINLIVHDDGSTNIPSPKVKRNSSKTTLETIVDLAVKRFHLENGLLLLREEATPFDLRGENLRVSLAYNATPSYSGEVWLDPLYFRLGNRHPTPVSADINFTIERDRIRFETKKLALAKSTIQATGEVTNLSHAEVRFRYNASVDLAEIQHMLEFDLKPQGAAQSAGNAFYAGASNFLFEGDLHASRVAVDLGDFHVRDTSAVSAMRLDPKLLRLTRLRLATSVNPPSAPKGKMLHVDGNIGAADLDLHTQNLDLRSVNLATLGGTFDGGAQFRHFETFQTEGTVSGFDARTLLAIYSPEKVPWDGLISGPVKVAGSLRRGGAITASADATISPAPGSEPVHGQIAARYDSKSDTLDLGDSTISLPATSVRFTGVLGRQLTVRVDTKNLSDILAPVGITPPIQLHNGEAIFSGTVTGKPEAPRIAGHATITNFVYDQQPFSAFAADVNASPAGVQLQNASLSRGSLQARFQGSVGLDNWKTTDASAISGTASIANAAVADLLAAAGQQNIPLTGTMQAKAQVQGTLSNPQVSAGLDVARGTLEGEPFDLLTAQATLTDRTIHLTTATLSAGTRRITASATYQHAPNDLETGSAQFQLTTNVMPLDQFRKLVEDRPGVKGTVQLTASGAAAISHQANQPSARLTDLHADIAAQGLALQDQRLGDAHLTAATQGQAVVVHVDSDFANSTIRGDGRFQLADDYPGTATIQFSNLDFARLRDWIAPRNSPSAAQLTGSAAGNITIAGPALDPAAWKASVTVPQFQLQPKPSAPTQGNPLVNLASLTLRNAEPISVTMQNDVIRVASAHFTANQTDIRVAGTVSPKQKSQLDLQVNGDVNLALLHSFDTDIVSSGQVQADAIIRGTLANPQFSGKLLVNRANLNYTDFPNGLSNVQGAILFSGTRASIQSLTAETGGGKVTLSGFAGFSGGEPVFRIQADAKGVRVRYPEGVSTVADASLTLTGSGQGSVLAGNIIIQRSGFNPHTDLASVLAKSSQPEKAPSAQTGFLADMQLDIQIAMAPDVTFQSTLAQNIQAEANLRLRGTVLNPAVLGRIVITQGQVVFFGTKFTIDQGSISFYNPVKIEPVLDIDFETKARGVDVILTVSGPISKLNLTPRSDPPLQFSEIIALLATGNAPISDPNLAIQQSNANTQSFQQLGASALLGQALANPVSGRLQRFFGVTKLRIDPSLQGVENNPQARLTIEQQVTPDITFTYITNITNSNPQVVRVEWALNRKWSVVALREENGLFGIDFLYKKRFK